MGIGIKGFTSVEGDNTDLNFEIAEDSNGMDSVRLL